MRGDHSDIRDPLEIREVPGPGLADRVLAADDLIDSHALEASPRCIRRRLTAPSSLAC